MKTLAQRLMEVRTVIDTPEKWTQKVYARRSDYTPCEPESREATCFCVLGALIKARSTVGVHLALYNEVGPALSVSRFNDISTHAEVMSMFDRAIEKAEANV